LPNDADRDFYDRAHAHLRAASEQLRTAPPGEVSASLMHACARFNAWVSASQRRSPAELRRAYGETIEYFVAEYRKMLVRNLDEYVRNFDQYHGPRETRDGEGLAEAERPADAGRRAGGG
jgi:hypothetical protein